MAVTSTCTYVTDPGDRFGWSGSASPPETCDLPCDGDVCHEHQEDT